MAPAVHPCPTYKPHPLRPFKEIRADILVLEQEAGTLLSEIMTN